MEQKFEGPPSLSIGAVSDLTLHDEAVEQLVYVFDGGGDANGTPVARDTAIHVPPGASLTLRGAMTVVVSTCPSSARGAISIARLDHQPVQRTGDRWYRELIQGETTMFVGSIPPGRAPDHFHLYEEVLCILVGVGVMHKAGVPLDAIHSHAATTCSHRGMRTVTCAASAGGMRNKAMLWMK